MCFFDKPKSIGSCITDGVPQLHQRRSRNSAEGPLVAAQIWCRKPSGAAYCRPSNTQLAGILQREAKQVA